MLPLELPIPPELTITNDPTATADNANVHYAVPSGAEAFDVLRGGLEDAGFELLPGTSDVYSTDVRSGAILARGEGFDINILIVEDDVEMTVTRSA
ncbi:MAG: hypothetical protein Q4G67_09575 [Actinomycetia bacterium]|nr:hypothetical protein [Actinomycetes bacterium]